MGISNYKWWGTIHDGSREQLFQELQNLNEQIDDEYQTKEHLSQLISEAYEDMKALNPRTQAQEKARIYDHIKMLKGNRDASFKHINNLKEEKEFVKARLDSRS